MTTPDNQTAQPGRRWATPGIATAIVAVVALVLMATGCGGSDDSDGDGDGANPGQTTESTAPMSVAEASNQPNGTTVVVTGFLIEDSGVLAISDSIAESYPPQSGGPRLEVEGIDLATVPGVNEEGPVRWLDQPVEITGTIEDGRIVDAELRS